MKNPILKNEAYYCHHICDDDEKDIMAFRVAHKEGFNLVTYLQRFAFVEEGANLARTYMVRNNITDELVAFFTLRAGNVSVDEIEVEDNGNKRVEFTNISGIEISNFAVNANYVEKYAEEKGVGIVVFTDFIRPLSEMIKNVIGCRILYIFALPVDSLLSTYESTYEFLRLNKDDEDKLHRRNKPSYDANCIFMYQLL